MEAKLTNALSDGSESDYTNTVAALSEQGSNSSIEKIKNILVETFVSFKHPITEAS